MAKSLNEAGVRFIADTSGRSLKSVLKHKPFLVKPNVYELEEFFGEKAEMKKNNKPAAKRYMKTVGMVMASVMVLSSTTGQMVYAESAKDQKDTQDGEKKEEKTIVYLNGKREMIRIAARARMRQ
mgnify:CR=1 FL=1